MRRNRIPAVLVLLLVTAGCTRGPRLTPLHERFEFQGEVEIWRDSRHRLQGDLVFHRASGNLQLKPRDSGVTLVGQPDGTVRVFRGTAEAKPLSRDRVNMKLVRALMDPQCVQDLSAGAEEYKVRIDDAQYRVLLRKPARHH